MLEREAIYQRVWGYAMAHGDRSVDVFVRKLRQKLERASPRWRYIHPLRRRLPLAPEPADGAAESAGGATEALETTVIPDVLPNDFASIG